MRTLKISSTEPQAKFHQMPHKYRAFVAGFGTGKSQTMADSAMMDALDSPSALIGIYEPTYDLIRLIAAPRMEQRLQESGIRYKYNKSENIIYTSSGQMGDFILRTLDNPARIVGYETYRAHIDELDTLKRDHAKEAWIKIIARNRQIPEGFTKSDVFNRASVYTTPEGFRFVYDRWVREQSEMYGMIQASTLTNPFLSDDYVHSLRESYPANLIDAYINGDFVNLTSGSIYLQYDRQLNSSDSVLEGFEPVYIGMDFNVANMSAVVHVKRNDKPIAVDEITGAYDTPDMIRIIKERYDDGNRSICIFPDASGRARKTVNASETDISLLCDAGFSVYNDNVNPAVKDRINAMNAALCNGAGERIYKVNASRCPKYVECLEQQVYTERGEPDKTQGKDHLNDAGGYFIAHDYPLIKPVSNVDIKWAM